MVVASGQMPYEFDAPLPIRNISGGWPGIDAPNIGPSGDTFEQAMFVLNAELRKWGYDGPLTELQYKCYTHPDITPSGFEPKADGETLTGLVTGTPCLISVDNIEQMRSNLDINFTSFTGVWDLYADDSVYGRRDFKRSWIQTAYPENPSGSRVIFHNVAFSLIGPDWLRPALSDVTGGDFIDTTDLHWLGGSGVLFDIDAGEVIFNPFPFSRVGFFTNASSDNNRFYFGPVYPLIQTTAGTLPSIEIDRYISDITTGTSFSQETNFDAIGSGLVQIDGYVLLPGTTIELVTGNDFNFDATLSGVSDYTGHTQGLRQVHGGDGDNDPSARVYRTPTAQPSGLYRVITYNKKADVPFTAIPSGFVSIWPEGIVILSQDGLFIEDNEIHGQELTVISDGSLQRDPRDSKGVHVMDDAIWMTSRNDSASSGNLLSRGMFPVSPYNGALVWYRPAELTVATSGTNGVGPGTFGVHMGLMNIGTDFVRVSKVWNEYFDTNTGDPTPNSDLVIFELRFQQYNKTTLDHIEKTVGYELKGEDVISTLFGAGPISGAIRDGSDVYVWDEFGVVHKFNTSLDFVNAYVGPIARRRHSANGQLLYTIGGNIQIGDPLFSLAGGSSSGIGVWSTTDPAGTPTDAAGFVTHDSAKLLRGETHFGHQTAARIHTIFDVTGSTHVANGVWMIIQFGTVLWLCRITEETTHWFIRESIRLERSGDTFSAGGLPADFPYEAILHDID